MHIPFAVFISLALALPTLAAPVVRDVETQNVAARHSEEIAEAFAAPILPPVVGEIAGEDSALEARTKVATKKKTTVKAKAPAKAKVAAKPKAATKAKPVPKKKVAPKPAAKLPVKAKSKATVKAKVPAKAATKAKLPTKVPVKSAAKPPAKAPVKSAAKPPTKAPVKGAAKPLAKAPSSSTSGKAAACKKPTNGASTKKTAAKKGPRRLMPRTVRHPSAKGTITLFHGTTATSAAAIVAQGPQISRTPKGDFNSKPDRRGLLPEHSLITAAQFACHENDRGSPDQVDVLEFTWHGSSAVHEFADQTNDWLDFVNHNLGPDPFKDAFHPQAVEIFKNDMASGPMNGPDDLDLTGDFFQYAIIKQAPADTKKVID
ncbi:hypothetical protein FB451DRAFT_1402662 [Mycena latifolia]|nr:hypothetical protein FB451DRAFT_1414958 [Mycena latifolia]KAJ7465649.1 hypothetical protein FB451DRAFT_1402662 [Mycena latifolia]